MDSEKMIKLVDLINFKFSEFRNFNEYGLEAIFITDGNEKFVEFDGHALVSTVDGPSDYKELLAQLEEIKDAYVMLYGFLNSHFDCIQNQKIEKEYGLGYEGM